MKILVACEFSGRVREAFAKQGHTVTSCDLLETELPVSENSSHYVGDIADILYDDWDMILAFPPCTYLALSGVHWLAKKEGRWEQMLDGVKFFNLFLDHPCPRICIENPIMHGHAKSRLNRPDYTQKIQPYHHGHPEKKSTCLWLKGLPLLRASNNVSEQMIGKHPGEVGKVHWESQTKDRQKNRSRTYQGIADAMANQWGTLSYQPE